MKNDIPPDDREAASKQSSLEEVRKRLQSFGYLNSRIGRFYLRSFSANASQFLNRCLLGFRIGVLSGSVAAILMSVGTLAFNAELLKNKIDLLLLFLYFEIFFVLLFSFLEVALIYAVSVWIHFAGARRLVIAGQIMSLLVALALFAYFSYWGYSQITYLRYFSSVSIVTMVVILTLSCIFVAKCAWLGFLVAFQELEIGYKMPNWRRYSLEVLLSLTAVLVLVPLVVSRQAPEEQQTPVAVLTTPDRWLVVGIDGISREILKQMMKMDAVPFLSKLMQESMNATLHIAQPVIPPVTWTTIATGVPPAQHGILMPEVRRWRGLSSWMQVTPLELAFHSILIHSGFGQRQPVSGYLRKEKAFWEILSDTGIRVGIVNWWGSWPARPLRGWNISERYYYKLLAGQPAQEETFPPRLFQQYSHVRKASTLNGPELDRFYATVFADQLKTDPVRVAALYLPGLDIMNYEFFETKHYDVFTYTDVYREHLRWLDETLARLHSAYPDYHMLLVLHQGRSLTNEHSEIVINPSAKSGRAAFTAEETQIAPLLLYTCGVPVSRMMNSGLIKDVIPAERLVRLPLRMVEAYPKKDRGESVHTGEFNDLLIEQMKSLGYLQ